MIDVNINTNVADNTIVINNRKFVVDDTTAKAVFDILIGKVNLTAPTTTEYGTAVEHGNLNKHGDFTQQYHIDDMQAQKDVVNMSKGSQISGNTAGEKLHSLADIIRSKTTAAQELANSTQNPIMSGATLKAHGPLLGYEHDYASQVASEASVVDKCADVMEIAEKMQLSSGQLDNASISWTGPIITALSGFIGRIKDAKKDKKTIKENREIEEEQI